MAYKVTFPDRRKRRFQDVHDHFLGSYFWRNDDESVEFV